MDRQPTAPEGRGEGLGKVILLGEHAVVYGHPALVCAIDRHVAVSARHVERTGLTVRVDRWPETGRPSVGVELVDATVGHALEAVLAALQTHHSRETCQPTGRPGLELRVRSDLPIAAGLGSSAALAVAATRALAQLLGVSLPPARLLEVAGRAEDVFHGRASGIDVAAAALGGVLRFRRSQPVCPVRLATPLSLVVAVMEPSPPTAELVESVAVQRRREPRRIDALLTEIGHLAARAEVLLETGEPARLGPLLDRNHALLRALGLSSRALERGWKAARAAGALGAKLTGAGGGGCLIALVDGTATAVPRALDEAGAVEVFRAQVGTTE